MAVRFTVDRSGRVVDAVIVTASGSTLLDEAALALLREAALPPFPPDMTQPRLTITHDDPVFPALGSKLNFRETWLRVTGNRRFPM